MTTKKGNTSSVSPFPRGVQFTPVPNPLLAGLLEEIDDIAELKVTLRVVWALHRKKAAQPNVTASEMYSDRSVAAMLNVTGDELEKVVGGALNSAAERGVLLAIPSQDGGAGTACPGFSRSTAPQRRSGLHDE